MSFSRISSGFILYMLGFIGMRSEDVILASFPRSGNTWTRFLLCNLISLIEWEGKTVDLQILNKTMPELGINSLLNSWPHFTIPRVIKTHKPHLPLFKKNRAIGVVRDPRDVMVSFYHYKKDRKGEYSGTFADFIRNRSFGLESWFRHYKSWQNHWTIMIRYGDLRGDTFREFSRILTVLGTNHSENVIRAAIDRSDIRNVRKVDKVSPVSGKNRRLARDGRSRQWVSYFDERDLLYYNKLVERFGIYDYIETKN